MGKTNNIGTYELDSTGGPAADGVYTIVAADGAATIAFKLSSPGAATVQGAARIGDFGPSVAIDLVPGESTVFTNPDSIDGFVLTIASGTVVVITNQ